MVGRAQEAEAVGQDLEHALGEDLAVASRSAPRGSRRSAPACAGPRRSRSASSSASSVSSFTLLALQLARRTCARPAPRRAPLRRPRPRRTSRRARRTRGRRALGASRVAVRGLRPAAAAPVGRRRSPPRPAAALAASAAIVAVAVRLATSRVAAGRVGSRVLERASRFSRMSVISGTAEYGEWYSRRSSARTARWVEVRPVGARLGCGAWSRCGLWCRSLRRRIDGCLRWAERRNQPTSRSLPVSSPTRDARAIQCTSAARARVRRGGRIRSAPRRTRARCRRRRRSRRGDERRAQSSARASAPRSSARARARPRRRARRAPRAETPRRRASTGSSTS